MSSQATIEELEQKIAQLSPNEQLKLMAHIAEQLSTIPLNVLKDDSVSQQRRQEADIILALCDAAAELWDGEFDSVEEISQIRKDRDEQLWSSTS